MSLARLTAVTLAAAAIGGVALAQPADPKAVQAGAYTLDPSHARVQFSVSHMGTSVWWGDFTGAKGALTIDPAKPDAATLEVTIPTGSVTTTNAKLDGELKDPTWFDAAKFPTITFKSTKVTKTGAATAKVTGDLTFHGVTKPVTLDTTFFGSGANPMNKKFTIGFNAKTHIKRSEFGVNKYVGMLGDDVELTISAPFTKN